MICLLMTSYWLSKHLSSAKCFWNLESTESVHVIDEFGEGMPVAWCLSNHKDFCSMVVFFSEIKKRCGAVQSGFFMSDMANQFYNAWVAVMGPKRPTKLLCAWHVDKAWKEELRKKVGDVVLEAEIYKMIRTCLGQTSENLFEDCLSGLLNYLECEPKAFETILSENGLTRRPSAGHTVSGCVLVSIQTCSLKLFIECLKEYTWEVK